MVQDDDSVYTTKISLMFWPGFQDRCCPMLTHSVTLGLTHTMINSNAHTLIYIWMHILLSFSNLIKGQICMDAPCLPAVNLISELSPHDKR